MGIAHTSRPSCTWVVVVVVVMMQARPHLTTVVMLVVAMPGLATAIRRCCQERAGLIQQAADFVIAS